MQPLKPQPMQQYVFPPILKPFVLAQRTLFNLQLGHTIGVLYHFSDEARRRVYLNFHEIPRPLFYRCVGCRVI